MIGWVYIVTNPDLRGKVKVGFTARDPSERIAEFKQAGLPRRHRYEFGIKCEYPQSIERKVHQRLRGKRHAGEWFSCSVEFAANVLLELVPEPFETNDPASVTPAAQEALRQAQYRLQEKEARDRAHYDKLKKAADDAHAEHVRMLPVWEERRKANAIAAAADAEKAKRVKAGVVTAIGIASTVACPPLLFVWGALGLFLTRKDR